MSTSKDSSTPDSSEESAQDSTAKDAVEETATPKKKGAAKKGDRKAKAKPTTTDTEPGTDKTTTPSRRRGSRPQPVPGMNPTWWAPVMCTLMIVGLLWIVVFYLLSNGTKDVWPIPGIGYGNLAIGFGMIMAGFLMTTRWK